MTTTQPVTTSQPAAAAATSRTAPTRTISVAGTPFAYRELGPRTGVPLVFLHHFSAVLDDWDPQVIDGIAAKRHVIARLLYPQLELEFAALLASTSDLAAAAARSRSQED